MEKLRVIEEKKKSIEQLLSKNQMNLPKDKQKVLFPLIGVMVKKGQTFIRSNNQERLKIESKEMSLPFGDIDMTLNLNKANLKENNQNLKTSSPTS